tara:strand:- start:113 stop:976 length:864 start_codon:yes stop_codon:yes gene_type:complete
MNIVFTTDENYIQHLNVALISLLSNNEKHQISVFILSAASGELFDDILRLNDTYSCNIKIVKIEESQIEGLKISSHITLGAYYRLLLSQVLPEIDKALYLDCDLVVQSDISELYETNIDDNYVGAVPDYFFHEYVEVDINPENQYFNSGVMLINLIKWRQDNIQYRLLEYASARGDDLLYWDQDVLNKIFEGSWKELEWKWNCQTDLFHKKKRESNKSLGAVAMTDAVIIHFTNKTKPWHYRSMHPMKKEYYKYLKKTNFNRYIPADRSLITIVKKIFKIILNKPTY